MEIKKDIDKTIFREYDIRGEYKTQIDEEVAYSVGRAYATKITSLGKTKCIIGHDNRLSGESLADALIAGITEGGIDVVYLGLVTTPMYYFACLHLGIDTGIMVTASHNPVGDNGFKIALSNYDNACGDAIKELYELVNDGEFTNGEGKIENLNIKNAYLKELFKDIKITRPLKVVVDPANATTATIIKDVFEPLPIETIYINEKSDGSFPSHHPDPSVHENLEELCKKVIETHADVGLAFDGDGDRIGIVDELGEIINPDTYMAIIWGDLMPTSANKTALFDVKCSKQLEDEIIRLGGKPYIYRTGNSYQKNKIKEMDLTFGGELSGHVFFRDRWMGFDDGIYAGLRLLEILSKTEKNLSELDDHLNKYYSTPEIKVSVTEESKFKIVDEVRKYGEKMGYDMTLIDGVRTSFSDGWALVRASNTGPNLTMRFEANTEERLEEIKEEFTQLVEKIKQDL